MGLPPWLTIGQTAEYCGVDRAEVYKMLRDLEVRRIGARGGVAHLVKILHLGRRVSDLQHPGRRQTARRFMFAIPKILWATAYPRDVVFPHQAQGSGVAYRTGIWPRLEATRPCAAKDSLTR